MKRKHYAAIDVGTNAGRMLIGYIAKNNDNNVIKDIQLVRVPLRLGEDVFEKGYISKKKIKKFILTLKSFRYLAKAYEVEEIMAYATSAMREAENRDEVIKLIKKETGIKLEIIDGTREAELIFKSFDISDLVSNKPFLFIDVGGGSTELTIFVNGQKNQSKSFKMGTIRVLKNKVKGDVWEQIQKWVSKHTQHLNNMSAIGTGGNINKIAQISRKRYLEPLLLTEIIETKKFLESYSLKDRVTKLRLKPDRADVIIPAADIYTRIMKYAKIDDIIVPKMGLTDGMILEKYYSELNARL